MPRARRGASETLRAIVNARSRNSRTWMSCRGGRASSRLASPEQSSARRPRDRGHRGVRTTHVCERKRRGVRRRAGRDDRRQRRCWRAGRLRLGRSLGRRRRPAAAEYGEPRDGDQRGERRNRAAGRSHAARHARGGPTPARFASPLPASLRSELRARASPSPDPSSANRRGRRRTKARWQARTSRRRRRDRRSRRSAPCSDRPSRTPWSRHRCNLHRTFRPSSP